ncbi:phage tail sheath family protein [Rhodocytophaga rosea]|uniref:Phage tail sheath family protein n=1 Tax=Rhodocytophaga rosea TaxID=2704465 RepID=A0A6C0GDE4_9BACT|nr:phage tail sheath C-terminal domain-containing protein [Rhodocytophaga rosea]QHT66029.1 phage tail sheath family protein [Rhodocytophaga rosea]
MAQTLATPGVYVEEKKAFPNSLVSIPTAVPTFIGYTEKAGRGGQSLINRPIRVTSLADYQSIFGGGFPGTFTIKAAPNALQEFDFELDGKGYSLLSDMTSKFLLYNSIRMFFANGGKNCYVISVGSYYAPALPAKPEKTTKEPKDEVPKEDAGVKIVEKAGKAADAGKRRINSINKKALEDAIGVLISEEEPTLLIIPEAVMLEEADCYALQQAMLLHCGFKMRNRFAILDVYNGFLPRTYDENDVITRFREGVGSNNLSYGAAYYPWVYSSIVQNEEVSYKSVSNIDQLETLLSREAELTTDNPKKVDEIKTEVRKLSQADTDADTLNQTLLAISPTFKTIMQKVRAQMNVIPPSAGMAGVYAAVDNTRGVWKAPANVGFNSVIAPVVKLTNDDQEDLNVTVTGKSVNAIRSFIGQGTVIWGARTLDGNSQDYRYINVRRTLIYMEQSIKLAAKAYVYEPNTAATWILIRSMIASFLDDLWRQGGLVGTTPDQAYEVLVGLGTTMTPNDILDGIMRISVKVAISRPAEFIVITFQQKMQES